MSPLSEEFLQRYCFDWEVLDVIIGGKSAIDSSRGLRVRGSDEVHKFMECYGYDIENPIEKAELFGNFQEALSFIRRYFLYPDNPDGLKIEVPRKIAELNDIEQLIQYASDKTEGVSSNQSSGPFLRQWACAVIKIMHTIAHIDKDLRTHYFNVVQTQILDRFYKFIHSDERGQVFLGKDVRDSDRVDLVAFDTKPKKSRDSVVLKLLHKPENVAEDIFDRVGIRFVTKNKFDSLRVIKFLRDRYIVMPANVKPSRSRNSLVDAEEFASELDKLLKHVEAGKLGAGDLDEKLVQFCDHSSMKLRKNENPHTSEFYQSIHFTGRQLIKFKNPLYDDLKVLKSSVQGATLPDKILKTIDRLDLGSIQKVIRFFYPFEVQIFDEASFRESEKGSSSHSNYKKSQIQAALKRVMTGLIV